MTSISPPPLLALTPGYPEAGLARGLPRAIGLAVEGGLRGVLLREPNLADREYLTLAMEVRSILDGVGGWLGLHDRPHLVGPARAQGVHLGYRSLPVPDARSLIPAGCVVGVSTHLSDQAEVWAGCDYRFFSPVRETASKPGPVQLAGLSGLAHAAAGGPPVYALGGIRPVDVRPCIQAGASGVAVLSGVLASRDPGGQARSYLEALP